MRRSGLFREHFPTKAFKRDAKARRARILFPIDKTGSQKERRARERGNAMSKERKHVENPLSSRAIGTSHKLKNTIFFLSAHF